MSIYKYVTPERIDVVERARIRFSQVDALNDPFELRPIFKQLATREVWEKGVLEAVNFERAIFQIYEQAPADFTATTSREEFLEEFKARIESGEIDIKSMVKDVIDEFIATDLPGLTRQAQEDLHRNLAENVGILSLTSNPRSELMWSHYADSHRGMVLEFDEKSPFFNRRRSTKDEFYHLRKVEYLNPAERAVNLMTDLEGARVFCAKHSQWSYESEQRVLSPLKDMSFIEVGDDRIYLEEFPKSALIGIILGCRSSDNLRCRLHDLIESDKGYGHLILKQARLESVTGDINW